MVDGILDHMRIIVTGSHKSRDKEAVYQALDLLHERRGVSFLVQGAADGVDYFAWQWAKERGVPCGSYAADWHSLGRRAGPIRNQEMIDDGADGVVAFPGGPGTRDCVKRAREAGIKVWEPYGKRRP